MGVQEKAIQYSTPVKIKWWYLPVLILGSMMIIGGIVSMIVI